VLYFFNFYLVDDKMVGSIREFLFVKVDGAADYIPVASTLKSLVDLFQKCVLLPFMSRQFVAGSHYYTRLEQKSILRCVVLLLPVIGNILVGIYDWKSSDKNFMLAAVLRQGLALALASDALRNDKELVLAAVRQNGLALALASDALRNDKEVTLEAVRQNGLAFWHVGYNLQNGSGLVHSAIRELESREKKTARCWKT